MSDIHFPECCGIGVGRYIPGMCPFCDDGLDEDADGEAISYPDCCGIGGIYIDPDCCPICNHSLGES